MRYQFVDCRWELGDPARGRALYLEAHIPGASFLDVDRDLSSTPGERGRHPLPDPEAFARAASAAGIGPDVLVVAYGTLGGAERLWWLLRHFGHERVAVLRGGIEAWAGPLAGGEEHVEPAGFVPSERSSDTIDADELVARLGERGLVVVDARTPERWRGEPGGIDAVPGRIPGAVNLPFAQASPVPREVLEAGEIVVYCGSGITACADLLALAEAGRPDARLYPGSWSEWSLRHLPLQRGDQAPGPSRARRSP